MRRFNYTSNCTSEVLTPFASDTNHFRTREQAVRFMRTLEKELASVIEKTTDCGADYYIFGDKEIVAETHKHDNATLIAEALACHSPYYSQIDVMSDDGLICHYLSADVQNDESNHIRRLRPFKKEKNENIVML